MRSRIGSFPRLVVRLSVTLISLLILAGTMLSASPAYCNDSEKEDVLWLLRYREAQIDTLTAENDHLDRLLEIASDEINAANEEKKEAVRRAYVTAGVIVAISFFSMWVGTTAD